MEFPLGGSYPVKLQAACLPCHWTPLWVFLKYFACFIIYCASGSFRGTLSGCFIILSKLFILILHGRKVF